MKTTPRLVRHGALLSFASVIILATGCEDGESRTQQARGDSLGQSPTRFSAPAPDSLDWSAVDQKMRRPGRQEAGGIYRYSMPRTDLTVVSHGVRIKPALSLGSWLAFNPINDNTAVAMGDLVLTEPEFNRVIARLAQGGVTPTAVHKHLPAHSPPLWWTHVEARGNPVNIAETVGAALALTGTPVAQPVPAPAPPVSIDTAALSQALGHAGKVNGGVYQVSIPRAEPVRAGDIEVPGAMGTATVLNFQPTGRRNAAINGDFVMTASEVPDVVQALEASGIQVVALHNHMLNEEPRLFFLHFWANDDAVKLARGLRSALDKMRLAEPQAND